MENETGRIPISPEMVYAGATIIASESIGKHLTGSDRKYLARRIFEAMMKVREG